MDEVLLPDIQLACLTDRLNLSELQQVSSDKSGCDTLGTRGFFSRLTRSLVGRNRNRKPRMKSLWQPGYGCHAGIFNQWEADSNRYFTTTELFYVFVILNFNICILNGIIYKLYTYETFFCYIEKKKRLAIELPYLFE